MQLHNRLDEGIRSRYHIPARPSLHWSDVFILVSKTFVLLFNIYEGLASIRLRVVPFGAVNFNLPSATDAGSEQAD
ncbi:MAG: hypothetical protein Ct9H300mP29_4540 [Candidatus Neomarinimicrobiota bacterium]|nr:MAG: hypothetical protein Ct9H300mP29_4540 [Candidatus Neomarinimicrobiota bacterium]